MGSTLRVGAGLEEDHGEQLQLLQEDDGVFVENLLLRRRR